SGGKHAHRIGVRDGVVEEGGLADAGLAMDDEARALPQPRRGERLVDREQLPLSSEQHLVQFRRSRARRKAAGQLLGGSPDATPCRAARPSSHPNFPTWRYFDGGSDEGDQRGEAQRVSRAGDRRARRDGERRPHRDRRQARALPSDGRPRAGDVVTYDAKTQRYELPAEQALALANEDSPAFVCGAFELATATLRAGKDIESAFKT